MIHADFCDYAVKYCAVLPFDSSTHLKPPIYRMTGLMKRYLGIWQIPIFHFPIQ